MRDGRYQRTVTISVQVIHRMLPLLGLGLLVWVGKQVFNAGWLSVAGWALVGVYSGIVSMVIMERWLVFNFTRSQTRMGDERFMRAMGLVYLVVLPSSGLAVIGVIPFDLAFAITIVSSVVFRLWYGPRVPGADSQDEHEIGASRTNRTLRRVLVA